MTLFFEGFQAQNVLILFLFSMKDSYLVKLKITPAVNIKLYTSMEHPNTS